MLGFVGISMIGGIKISGVGGTISVRLSVALAVVVSTFFVEIVSILSSVGVVFVNSTCWANCCNTESSLRGGSRGY